jgi:predicted dehydrogenase
MSGSDFSPLRVAVIGLGPMGQNHVRAIAETAGATLAAVVDIDEAVRAKTASAAGCPAYADLRALIGRIDAAIVAVPPEQHAAVAVPLLEAGIHCLIEKPLSTTPEDARAIGGAVGDAVVAVGHIERFNPALQAILAMNLVRRDVANVVATRRAPRGGRAVATDVVADMMVHDIDIVVALKGADVAVVTATGDPSKAVTAQLTFTDGSKARLTAERDAERRERTLTFTAGGEVIAVDFLERRARRDTHELPVTSYDALRTQLRDFLDAIRHRRSPRVTLADARAGMDLVWRIQAALTSA